MYEKIDVLLSCIPDSPFKKQLQTEFKHLQAENIKLREAFAGIKQPMLMTTEHGIECLVYEFSHNPFSIAREAPATPAQPLQEHDDAVRREERLRCLECYSHDDSANDWADKIRARGSK